MTGLGMHSDSFHDHPYAQFVHTVEKPARYVGGEWGQVRKRWQDTLAKVCLAFPDIYDIGMSHLGTRILYNELNACDDILCERAFVPWIDMEKVLRERGLALVSLENAKPLCDFDVVGISLQHELVFSNVLTLLDLGSITLRSDRRGDTEPLVLAGGSVASHPEPIAPFVDAFVIGDGERKDVEVVRRWVADARRGVPRAERLRNLASIDSVYVPALYQCELSSASKRLVVRRPSDEQVPYPVTRAVLPKLDDTPFPPVFPTGGPEAVFDRFSIEIARGCSQSCRFCQAGMIFRPERERPAAQVVSTIVESLTRTGQDEISLTSLSPADYSCITSLVKAVSSHPAMGNAALNVSSLRAYGVSDSTLDELRRVRVSNLTFAPEAGTQRMRDVINKNITEQQLLDTVGRVVERGWDRVKLYFMIGLPTETDEDVDGIIELTAAARQTARVARGPNGRQVQVTASASTFVPKPHTPFQWAPMLSLEEIVRKHRQLAGRARYRKVDIKTHERHGSVLEGILARGDRRLADVIERAWHHGARFDAWDGNVKWDVWTEAFDHVGLVLEDFLAPMDLAAPLPWSHIDVGVSTDHLRREWEKALRAHCSLPCLRPAREQSEALVCYHCGLACDLREAAKKRQSAQTWAASHAAVNDAERACAIGNNSSTAVALPLAQTVQTKPTDAPPVAYRLQFEKLGSCAMLGHLDLVREVPRVLRRAGTKLYYTQGFHPKPVMVFGPALSLGVPSFQEYIDIKTQVPMHIPSWLERINEACPDGMRFTDAMQLAKGSDAVINAVRQAVVLLALYPSSNAASISDFRGYVACRIEHILEASSLEMERRTKGKIRRVDVRPFVLGLSLAGDNEQEKLHRAGIADQGVLVELRQAIASQGSVRLEELVRLLIGADDSSNDVALRYRAVRVALTGPDNQSVMQG